MGSYEQRSHGQGFWAASFRGHALEDGIGTGGNESRGVGASRMNVGKLWV